MANGDNAFSHDSVSSGQLQPLNTCVRANGHLNHRKVSAFLAGMQRSTGLTFKTDRAAGENKDMTKWIEKYLGVGEWVMDQSVAIAGSSGWFERRR
ncbi:hypothetical protein BDP55DRAFT_727939 [Colletotrichum godetiae]|uniref:Uncharacterized protein n=3 Tax=Colletotrichum acutatum species complex TaxID=2707335 RepID=A0AAJ0AQB1_9PEZI|nr:uncharacterized protein BDP55DRAFT_727939 [Colletotrichum godetiae]KAK1676633.1 hypothetical protein BDP55DRAFT_727939 [Colletotrichum godetiae]